MAKIIQKILDLIFPPICAACEKKLPTKNTYVGVCEPCFNSIEIASGFICPKCKKRLPEIKPLGGRFCHPEEKFILAAATNYKNEAARKLIYGLKYGHRRNIAETLAVILKKYLEKLPPIDFKDFIVLPLPLHKKKERARGFNQTFLIAQALNSYYPLNIRHDLLFKNKPTVSQIETKDYATREKNVAGSFSIRHPEEVESKNIIVLDDVFTSGATLREAVKTLKGVGAKKIIALVIAKA
ncbi:MAG: ComF family protein [Patescibacteria group bacterium]